MSTFSNRAEASKGGPGLKLLDTSGLSVVAPAQGFGLLLGKTFSEPSLTLQGRSPLLGEIKGDLSAILLHAEEILLKQLERYGLSKVPPE
jgi:hypothetical protein